MQHRAASTLGDDETVVRHDVELVQQELMVRNQVLYEECLFMRIEGVSPRWCVPAQKLYSVSISCLWIAPSHCSRHHLRTLQSASSCPSLSHAAMLQP